MNERKSSELEKLIESMTTTGLLELNALDMKKLKSICRQSDDNIERVFRLLFHYLNKNHSQIRVTTLLIINELFNRSHRFRQLICNNLYELFELCLEINGKRKLPKPKSFAIELKNKSIEFIQKWNQNFGEEYEELSSAFKYLIDHKIVDFNDRLVVNESQRKLLEEEEIKKKNIIKLKVEKAIEELKEIETEVKSLFTQINNCFELLLPKMDSNYESNHCFNNDQSLDRIKPLTDFSIEIVIKPFIEILKNEDTIAIIDNMKDSRFQLSKICAFKLKRLLHIMSKGFELCQNELKRAIDMKYEIESIEQKFLELKIINNEDLKHNSNQSLNNESDSSDDDFEEVEQKEGLELIIPEHRRKEYGLEALSMASTSSHNPLNASTSSQSLDVETNEKRCNAILPSGKLCPRKDKVKCPFHGLIIPRDISGVPLNEEHRKAEDLKKANALPDWQNPQLLQELKHSVGIDLTVGKRKRRKYPALQDIKLLENTSRKRLEKKIFKKVVRERVEKDLNSINWKNHTQYENQWNYSLQS